MLVHSQRPEWLEGRSKERAEEAVRFLVRSPGPTGHGEDFRGSSQEVIEQRSDTI